MPKRGRAVKVLELLCANRICMSYGEVRNCGTTPEAVLNLRNKPCRVFRFRAGGMHWLCAEGAPVPVVIRHVLKLLYDALNAGRNGYVIIYYRNLHDLPYLDYMRALHMLRELVRTCKCEVRTKSYKCPAECVREFADAIAVKVKYTFGVQI